ncbi:MAG: IS4 family transposase [Gemmatimonadales bacterium]
MHASPIVPLLHRWLQRACPAVHAARATAVVTVVEALVLGAKLALTSLGRNLRSAAFAKHSIKRVDRLLGNHHLHAERAELYRAIAHWLLAATPRPVLLIDWADCGPGHRWLLLRAAVPLGGRAVPVYEEVHPLRCYNSPRTHRRFLAHLCAVLPTGCAPTLITDAGFRGPWFREVERCGWHWIGRVRNQVKYRLADEPGDGAWADAKTLYPTATSRPRHLGRAVLARRQSYACELYLVRQYRRGPGRPRKAHGHDATARRCRQLHKDPWLLATSLPHTGGAARRIVKLYALRMKIEAGIRDTKDARWGFALRYARSRRAERLEVLLLVAALGTLACWLAGLAAEAHQWGRHFQANTVRRRAVLSTVFVGRQLLTSVRFHPSCAELRHGLQQLPALVVRCATVA